MTSLWVVRHAEPSAGYGDDADPGLSDKGHIQAAELAERLAATPKRPVFSSTLRRARQTAEPLAKAWGVSVAVAPVIGEIPSPTADLAGRAAWLEPTLAGRWTSTDPDVVAWRDAVVEAARGVEFPQVWFSHFVSMNVLVSHAMGSDRVTVARPTHAAVLELDIGANGTLSIVNLSDQGDSIIR